MIHSLFTAARRSRRAIPTLPTPAACGLGAALIFAGPLDDGAAHAAADIQTVVSAGGIEAWLVEEHSIPIIALDIAFIGGAALDPDDKAGRAAMMTSMLDEGAGPYDAAGFAARKDEIAARIGFEAGRDTVGARLTMLSDLRDESAELFRVALTEPRFEDEALEKVRNQFRSILRQHSTDPNQLASKAFFKAMFPGDPYGRPRLGRIETIETLSAEDMRDAHRNLLDRGRMRVGVVGAITAEELGPLLDKILGALPASAAEPPARIRIERPGGVEVIPFDAPQSTVVFGHEGLARNDPDFMAAYVMNYVLGGGGFSSRLTEEVREKRGLAYSVYSYLAPLDRAALYLGGVATANERVAQAIEVLREEWRRMAEEGVTAEELDAAKRYLTGAYPLRFDSNGKIASFLVSAQLDGLGLDYIKTRNSLVEAVTAEDISRVAKRILQEERLFFAVVGQPEGIETSMPDG
ncbi:MAG: pitrilysin family protein [Pseudomonadota bacterium]